MDPGRTRRIYRHFDEQRGFAAYCALCRGAFSRYQEVSPVGALEDRGFLHLNVLEPEVAEDLLERVRCVGAMGVVK